MEKLCDRRDLALLCLMYDLYKQRLYERIANRVTRAANGYVFDLTVPHMSAYSKSPYYMGANMWNSLPINIWNSGSKEQFKQNMRDYLKQ